MPTFLVNFSIVNFEHVIANWGEYVAAMCLFRSLSLSRTVTTAINNGVDVIFHKKESQFDKINLLVFLCMIQTNSA